MTGQNGQNEQIRAGNYDAETICDIYLRIEDIRAEGNGAEERINRFPDDCRRCKGRNYHCDYYQNMRLRGNGRNSRNGSRNGNSAFKAEARDNAPGQETIQTGQESLEERISPAEIEMEQRGGLE